MNTFQRLREKLAGPSAILIGLLLITLIGGFQNCSGPFNPGASTSALVVDDQPSASDTQPTPSQILLQKLASAFAQAVTDGPDDTLKRVTDEMLPDKSVDFRDCNSTLSLDPKTCQRIVYDGKDAKTIFMDALNEKSVFSILPPKVARKALTMEFFNNLADPGSGLSPDISKINLLRDYLTGIARYDAPTGPGPLMLTFFDDIADTSVTEMSIDITVEQFPKYYPADALYFWALTVGFTPAAGRADWWGHIGIQIASNSKCGSPLGRCANWGGGGKGDGTGDYGAGGSDTINYPWEAGVTYTYRILRKDKIVQGALAGAWNWEGQIVNKKTGVTTSVGYVIGGDSIVTTGTKQQGIGANQNNPHVMTETGYGVTCRSPGALVSWSELKLNSKPFAGKAVALDKDTPCTNTLQVERSGRILHGLSQVRPPGYQLTKTLSF